MNHTLHLRWGAALLIALAASAVAAPKDKKEKDKGKVDVSLTAPAAHASYTAPAAIVMAAHAMSIVLRISKPPTCATVSDAREIATLLIS